MLDLAQTAGQSQLAKQHGDALRPTAKALAVPFRSGLFDQAVEGGAGHDLQDLAEQARIVSHGRGPLGGGFV